MTEFRDKARPYLRKEKANTRNLESYSECEAKMSLEIEIHTFES